MSAPVSSRGEGNRRMSFLTRGEPWCSHHNHPILALMCAGQSMLFRKEEARCSSNEEKTIYSCPAHPNRRKNDEISLLPSENKKKTGGNKHENKEKYAAILPTMTEKEEVEYMKSPARAAQAIEYLDALKSPTAERGKSTSEPDTFQTGGSSSSERWTTGWRTTSFL